MSVLSNKSIEDEFARLFVDGTASKENIRAAKYYLTLSRSNLILPSGKRYGEDDRCSNKFTIEPGETAFVSTAERIKMPPRLVGIIGPQFNSAEQGVLFFGGMLVDPGFGLPQNGEPLSFYIANLGTRAIELRPGEDTIAAIAFFTVDNPAEELDLLEEKKFGIFAPQRAREALFDQKEPERPPAALGQVESVSEVIERIDKVEASVSQVVMLGIVVLIAALLGAITAALFAIKPSSVDGKRTTVVHHASGAISHHVTSLPASGPDAETLALVFGAIICVSIVLAGIASLSITIRAKGSGVNRKISRLRVGYPKSHS